MGLIEIILERAVRTTFLLLVHVL